MITRKYFSWNLIYTHGFNPLGCICQHRILVLLIASNTNLDHLLYLIDYMLSDHPELALMRRLASQLTLKKIEIFCLVAELQSVTRAAERLFISQPVVTAHLRGLEEKLGAPLFKREGRGVALTPAGNRVFKWAREIVAKIKELERALVSEIDAGSGRAVVASSMSAGSYLLPPIVCNFQLQHPEGLVEVVISNPQAALDSARTGDCDFSVLIISPDQITTGLTVEPLWDEPLLLMSAPNSRWVGDTAGREEISKLPFISTSNSAVMYQLEEGQLRYNGIPSRKIVLYLGHPEAQKEAVRQDVGVCFFTLSAVEENLKRRDMRWVNTPGLNLSIPLYILHRDDKDFSAFQLALKAFIEHARP